MTGAHPEMPAKSIQTTIETFFCFYIYYTAYDFTYMRKLLIRYLLLAGLVISAQNFRAADPVDVRSLTLSGFVRDAATGEELIGANVFVKKLGSGTITNKFGYYSLTLPASEYQVSYSYVGYGSVSKTIDLLADTDHQYLSFRKSVPAR